MVGDDNESFLVVSAPALSCCSYDGGPSAWRKVLLQQNYIIEGGCFVCPFLCTTADCAVNAPPKEWRKIQLLQPATNSPILEVVGHVTRFIMIC
eukprot:scaffold26915_cov71-Attheya_sp.AAC.4